MKLGINIDHVATLRNARGGTHPSVLRAAEHAKAAGADSLTIHLREDRRHIRDADVAEILSANVLPVNLEMAATPEMLSIALAHKPFAVCIVPEKREELTTEGGLDVAKNMATLAPLLSALHAANIRTSLFIDANAAQVHASKAAGAACVEIHTGAYAEQRDNKKELADIRASAALAKSIGLEVHAGHGLTFENVSPIAAISDIVELNIGHFLMGEALFTGLKPAIEQMRYIINQARAL